MKIYYFKLGQLKVKKFWFGGIKRVHKWLAKKGINNYFIYGEIGNVKK